MKIRKGIRLGDQLNYYQPSDSFVFVISQASVESEVCHREIEHAIKQNKRLIPIVREKVEDKTVPEKLREINFIFFCEVYEFENEFTKLLQKNDLRAAEEWLHYMQWRKNHRDLAVSYYNIGVIFEGQGKLTRANKEYMAAYEPAKKAAELDPEWWKEFFDDVQSKISQSVK